MLKINRLHFTQEVHDTTPEGQQKMKDMNLYAKSKKITISNGTTHTHDIISYLPFQAELLIWKANYQTSFFLRWAIKKVIPIFSAHRRKKLVW